VVEAQTHAGGRGKADGVNLAHFVEEEARLAGEILGMTLMTHQTNPHGRVVSKVLVEADLEIEKELYLGIVPDRTSATPVFMARETAEMDIEEVIVKR
jgi:succinyl-CoA synthetase beta subunit